MTNPIAAKFIVQQGVRCLESQDVEAAAREQVIIGGCKEAIASIMTN
jgi:hypothetical protein